LRRLRLPRTPQPLLHPAGPAGKCYGNSAVTSALSAPVPREKRLSGPWPRCFRRLLTTEASRPRSRLLRMNI